MAVVVFCGKAAARVGTDDHEATVAKNPALLVPPHRQDTAEPTQRKAFGLVSYQNRLRQIRRKHREAEYSADVRPVHVLLRRNRLHARHLAGVDQGAVVAV